jgi:PKD repeat protein
VASITASVNGGTPSTVAGASRTLTFSAQGRYTVTYFATDNAGNQSAPKTITVVVDKTAPSTTASASPGKVSNGPITVTFNATDPAVGGGPGAGVASITTSVNGAAPTTVAGATRSLTFTAEGTYTVTYFATDNVGNAGAPQTITVVIDATAPTARSTSSSSLTVLPQSGDSDAGPTLLEGTAADNRGVTKVRVRFHAAGDSDLVYDQTFTASCPGCGPTNTPVNWSLNLSTLGLPSGLYDTEITAFDQAGNTTTIAGPRVFVQ